MIHAFSFHSLCWQIYCNFQRYEFEFDNVSLDWVQLAERFPCDRVYKFWAFWQFWLEINLCPADVFCDLFVNNDYVRQEF